MIYFIKLIKFYSVVINNKIIPGKSGEHTGILYKVIYSCINTYIYFRQKCNNAYLPTTLLLLRVESNWYIGSNVIWCSHFYLSKSIIAFFNICKAVKVCASLSLFLINGKLTCPLNSTSKLLITFMAVFFLFCRQFSEQWFLLRYWQYYEKRWAMFID